MKYMYKILIDTSVWLELARDPRQTPLLEVLNNIIKRGLVTLIVPRTVLDEFRKNKDRIAKESAKSLSTHFRLVRDAVGKIGGDKRRVRSVLAYLEDVDHKIPIIGGGAIDTLNRIEELLTGSNVIEPTESVKLRAAQRALEKRAPFHRGKNSIADAVIIETYADCISIEIDSWVRFAFITHNKIDFSTENGDHKIPHPDIASYFSNSTSFYFLSLAEALHRISPSLVRDLMPEYSWTPEPRGLAEILEAEELFYYQVWYNRHQILRELMQEGKITLVDKFDISEQSLSHRAMEKNIWKGALKAAREVERRFGKKNLGPWTDFEWGMINGKLSALRWVLGDDWDMLDT